MEPITFFKMSGSGNDFIIVDNREKVVKDNDLPGFINRICRRADGFILIEPSDKADFKWRFFNSDGSKAEMCGNGARCAARFAYVNGIAGKNLSFETEAGVVSGQVKDDRAKVKMPDPVELRLDYNIELKSGPVTLCSVNTGVPHVRRLPRPAQMSTLSVNKNRAIWLFELTSEGSKMKPLPAGPVPSPRR